MKEHGNNTTFFLIIRRPYKSVWLLNITFVFAF